MDTDATTSLLSQLRDIQAPQGLPWWPPAPGWFIVSVLSLAIIFWLTYCYKQYRKKQLRRQSILQHIRDLQQNLVEEHYPIIYQDLSTLLRRIALMTHERTQVAHLAGEEWLKFLDDQCGTHLFTHDVGRLLLTAPYFPGNETVASPEPLLKITEEWIKRCT